MSWIAAKLHVKTRPHVLKWSWPITTISPIGKLAYSNSHMCHSPFLPICFTHHTPTLYINSLLRLQHRSSHFNRDVALLFSFITSVLFWLYAGKQHTSFIFILLLQLFSTRHDAFFACPRMSVLISNLINRCTLRIVSMDRNIYR